MTTERETRLIADIVKDGTGQRWEECRVLPLEVFTDGACRRVWREISRAKSYDQAALAGREFFGYESTGIYYVNDRNEAFLESLRLNGFERLDEWIATLPRASGSKLVERINAARLDLAAMPPEPREVLILGGVCIGTPGNLGVWCAAAKAGKTAALGAAIGCTMTDADRDFLGFTGYNSLGRGVVHFDTEQSPVDHWKVIDTARRRAGLDRAPAWLHSYGLAGWSAADRRRALPLVLRLVSDACGGIHSVFIDGVADFVDDPNDGAVCFPFVDGLQRLAVEHDCPITSILHRNPGSEKSRGHLGSHLERRAETNLVLEKDPATGRTVIYSTKQRRAPLLKADAPCFRWDTDAGMHISVVTVRADRERAERDRLRELAADAYAEAPGKQLKYGQLVEAVTRAARCSTRTAEARVCRMKQLCVIREVPLRYLEFVP